MIILAKILLCWITGIAILVVFTLGTYLFQIYPVWDVISMFFGLVVFPTVIGALLIVNVLWKDKV